MLTAGIILATKQLLQDRLFNRVLQTGGLIKDWNKNKYWIARSRLDKYYEPEDNKSRANKMAAGIARFKGFKRFRNLDVEFYNFIEETSRLAEQMELYISRGAADLGLIADHIGYDILALYYALQDVISERSLKEDLYYEGFRDLALRVQHYARLHQQVDIRDVYVWACFPPLPYRGGDESDGYPMSRFYRWRLKRARLRFMREL